MPSTILGMPSPSLSSFRSSSAGSPGSVSLLSTTPSPLASSKPSSTPPPSLSAATALVVVAAMSPSGVQLLAAGSVSAWAQSCPCSRPSGKPSASLSGSSTLMTPSPSLSKPRLFSSPSRAPSSSVSASLGSLPSVFSKSSLRPSPSLSVTLASSVASLGSVSVPSMAPLRLVSSEPSLTPPPSLSGLSGSVVVALSASGVQLPAATLVSARLQS